MKERGKRSKYLNRIDVLVLAFGAMIGWSWVLQSGTWIETAGTLGAIIAFLLGGIVVMFVGQVYAELTACVGGRGVIDFALRGGNKTLAFIATWSLVLGYFSVCAFESVALPTVLTYLFPSFQQVYLYSIAGTDIYLTWVLTGVASAIIIGVVNCFGIKRAAVMQTILTFTIAVCGLALIGGGFVNGEISNLKPMFSNGAVGLLSVLAMTPFMYVGFDVIPAASGEFNMSQRRIGRLLIISVGLAVAWYVLIILGTSLGLDETAILTSDFATADAMGALYGGSKLASTFLICGGLAGILSAWNAFIMGSSRAVASLAQEGMLPKVFGKIHPKYKVPTRAIVLIICVNAVAPFLGKGMLTWLVNAGGMATTLTYLLVSVSFLILRKREPELSRPYPLRHWKFIGYGAVALCAILLCMYLPFSPSGLEWPYEWAIVIAWALLGIILFVISKVKK